MLCGNNPCYAVAKYLVNLSPELTLEDRLCTHDLLILGDKVGKENVKCVCWLLIKFTQEFQGKMNSKKNFLNVQTRINKTRYSRNSET